MKWRGRDPAAVSVHTRLNLIIRSRMGLTPAGRGILDISFDADPGTGVAIYDSTPVQGSAGWFVVDSIS
ncbi:MAG: hypothetical protein ABSC17_06205 [Thermacetogeniaceae bacterium]